MLEANNSIQGYYSLRVLCQPLMQSMTSRTTMYYQTSIDHIDQYRPPLTTTLLDRPLLPYRVYTVSYLLGLL